LSATALLLIQKYFWKGHDFGGKLDLSKNYWNLKRKMWLITHFSDIIKQPQFEKRFKMQIMYGIFFPNLSSIISEKCAVTSSFLFGF